jgi:nucleoside-diphosphate-sugar epimerase
MRKILVVGTNSFVGSNFKKYSKYREIDEISLIEKKPAEIEFAGIDVVLHLAAIVHRSDKIQESEYFRVNCDLCLDVAKGAKLAGVRQFVFLSTLKVFGVSEDGDKLRNEDSDCFPDDAYGKSKYTAENELRKLEDSHFIVSIVRTPLVYGEGVRANMLSLVKLVDTFPFLPFDNINNKRNFTFAENLIGYIDQIISNFASGIFIAMDDNSISTTELIRYISNALGKKSRLFRMPRIIYKISFLLIPHVIDRLYSSLEFDNSKTKAVLNFTPRYSTEEGIKKMVTYYIQNKKK